MTPHVLFVQHLTRPGARADAQHAWRKHMQPAIAANPGHLLYAYAFAAEADRICAFQVYRSREDAQAFLETAAYAAYESEVAPFLAGPPRVEVLDAQWIKGLS